MENGYYEELDYLESLGRVEVSHRDALLSQRTSVSSVQLNSTQLKDTLLSNTGTSYSGQIAQGIT